MTNETKTKLARKAKWLAVAVLMAGRAMAENAGMAVTEPASAAPQQPKAEPKRQILVSIADRKLALLKDGRVVKVYPVAVGAKVSPSPTGEFRIASRVVKPTYYHQGTMMAPGPHNPVGTRWMGLTRKGYGIHGTNAPQSIGKAASHGCIRMAKGDLEQLFEMVRVGDAVEIRGAADAQTVAIFGQTAQPIELAEAKTARAAARQ